MWDVVATSEYAEWEANLGNKEAKVVDATLNILIARGPILGRPLVDRLHGSTLHNLKELRPRGAAKNCRILFAFDPDRKAVLLLGGDKTGKWNKWYSENIPHAEVLYDRYLKEIGNHDG